jgi:adenylate cyclase
MEDGDALMERALDLNPNHALAWLYSSWIKTALGEPETALKRIAQAQRFSPNDPQRSSFYAAAAYAHFFAGRHEDAHLSAQAAIRDRPNFLFYNCIAAVSAALAGHPSEAQRAVRTMLRLDPSLRVSTYADIFVLRRSIDAAKWRDALRLAGLPE